MAAIAKEMMNEEHVIDKTSQDHARARSGVALFLIGGIVLGGIMAFLTVMWSSSPSSLPGFGLSVTSIPDRVAVGAPAPEINGQTQDGKNIRLSALRGSVVAINFWATWCGPCRTEMPELEQAMTRYSQLPLVVLGVNAGEQADKVKSYMTEVGVTFDSVLDLDGTIIDAYEITAFPTTVWIDAQGTVRAKHLGPLTKDFIDRYVAELKKQ